MNIGLWILYDILFGGCILGNIYILCAIGCKGNKMASCYHVLFPTLAISILGETIFSLANVFNHSKDSCVTAMVMVNYFEVMNLVTVSPFISPLSLHICNVYISFDIWDRY